MSPSNRPRRQSDLLLLSAFALSVVLAAPALVAQCPNGGFQLPPVGQFTQQCFPDASGPGLWVDPGSIAFPPGTSQTRTALQSPHSTAHTGLLPTGTRPSCSGGGSHPPVGGTAPTVAMRLVGRRVIVDYEAPNYYCQNTGDWPPAFTYATDWSIAADHLSLTGPGGLIAETFIYFEKGEWDTGIDLACGSSATYLAQISYVATVGSLSGSSSQVLTLPSGSACTTPPPDHRQCPVGAGAGPSVGQPINVGSGDVTTSIPLFTMAQSPLSLSFELTYHSSSYKNPSLVSWPVGLGWFHPYAQTLRAVSPTVLYHISGEGYESEYTKTGSVWVASSPGELRGTVTQDSGTNELRLQDLDGNITGFDGTNGRWKYTKDRWNNQITATYTGNNLTGVTDSVGRTVTLTYSGSQVRTISLPDGQQWQLGYAGTSLISVQDPLHSSTNWRNMGYANPLVGTIPLLISMTDDGGGLLEGHEYNDPLDRGTKSFAGVYSGGNYRNQVTVAYDMPTIGSRTVTSTIDVGVAQTSVFVMTYQAGRWLPLEIAGPCTTCSGAGSDSQSFIYFPDNHLAQAIDGKSTVTEYSYDANGNVLTRTEAKGTGLERATIYEYSYASWPRFWTKMTQPSVAKPGFSKVTTRTWSGAGETTLTVSEDGYALGSNYTYETTLSKTSVFDSAHRLLSVGGPRTDVVQVWTYTYFSSSDGVNQNGRLKSSSTPWGLTTSYGSYDIFGTARSEIDPNGVETRLETDGRGRVISRTVKAVPGDPNEAVDYTTTFAFDSRDRLLRTVLPRSNATANKYEATVFQYEEGTNRLTDTIRVDAANLQRERLHLTLNVIGGKVQEEAQQCSSPAVTCGSWVQKRSDKFTYDAKNRLLKVIHPVPLPADSTYVQYTYDANGLVEKVQDEVHAAPNTIYAYDALNRVTTVTQKQPPAGADVMTSYAYDAHDNVSQVTDPNLNITTYAYDDFGRLGKQVSPVTGTTTYTYDADGNLISKSLGNSFAWGASYDQDNRVTHTSAAGNGSIEEVWYTYNYGATGTYLQGRLATMTDPTGSVSYSYDRRGLVKAENRVIGTASYPQAYGYDANGNRSSVTYPSGRVVAYSFDFADRQLTASSGTTTYGTAAYAPFGPETSLTYGNGAVRTMTPDLRYRPATLTLTGAGQNESYTYGVDGVGNIGAITDNVTSAYSRTFGYDHLNRLTSATTGTGGTPPLWGTTGSYTYDALGNRLTMNLGSRAVTYAYDFMYGKRTSRLASVTEGATKSVTHDLAGNELTFGTGYATYSARNMMNGFSPSSSSYTAFKYDGRGLRVVEQITGDGGEVFFLLPACRVFNTLNPNGPYGGPAIGWGPNNARSFTLAGQCGIPQGAVAVSYNLTAIGNQFSHPTAYLTLQPSLGLLFTYSLRYGPNLTIATNGIAGLQNGSLVVYHATETGYADSDVHALLDVTGYFALSGPKVRHFFYTPEMNLLGETDSTFGTPAPLYDYVWMNGRPIAQETVGNPAALLYTVTDHLGTPFLQMNTSGATTWRVEYEPFGQIYAYRASSTTPQPFRFPGQEERSPNWGTNYNIFRWYRSDIGQYTQADPLGLSGGLNLGLYAEANPIVDYDADGLASINTSTRELTCFFCTVFAESRGQSAPCQWAVASVIVNLLADERAKHPGKATGLCDAVRLKGHRFDGFGNTNEAYRHCSTCSFAPQDKPDVEAFATHFANPFPVAPDARFFGTDRRGRGYIKVPFPECPGTLFYNEDPSARRRRR